MVSDFIIRSSEARSVLRIFPRRGRIAWVIGLRPWIAEPPAESPSTMNSSHSAGSEDWQSFSLSGIPADSKIDLRLVDSRAFLAARRARAASIPFWMINFASLGWASNQSAIRSVITRWTKVLAIALPSLVFVCPSNCGTVSLTEITATSPSRTSSPERFSSLSLRMPFSRAYRLTRPVSAERKPSSWVPPSVVEIVLAKVWTDSEYPEVHCMAISAEIPCCVSSASISMISSSITADFLALTR